MTLIVEVPGYPDRLACQDCGCQLVARREDEPWRYVQTSDASQWTGVLEVDEPPLQFDLDDGCPCHASYLRVMRHAYEETK